MNKPIAYSYSVLRYVHDITSGEFINVGIAIHAPEAAYTKMLCRHTYGRLSRFFPGMKHDYFKVLMKHIESNFNKLGDKLYSELPWKSYKSVQEVLKSVLPEDDSALQWSSVGVGRASNIEDTAEKLFQRMVLKYEEKVIVERRTEEDVWRVFKNNLEIRNLLKLFEPRKIGVKDDEVEFHHTWKNGILHCLEPVSFDLSSADNICDKAYKWLGKMSSISSASEKFKVYFLVGQPQDQKLHEAYEKAISILHKAPIEKQIVSEQDVELLSNMIQTEYVNHDQGVYIH